MPGYPLTFTITNPHSKILITGKVQGTSYPVTFDTVSVEDLFDTAQVLVISVTVE